MTSRERMQEAMEALGPDRFILSPVDNVTGDSGQTWHNVQALIETWKELRDGGTGQEHVGGGR